MIVELILFLAFVVAVGAAIVKAYEWRHDALYGPYTFPAFPHQNKRMNEEKMAMKHLASTKFSITLASSYSMPEAALLSGSSFET